MIYFIHNQTSRSIKIGFAWNPAKRLSTLQTSTSNNLVLLGSIAGMKPVEKHVHELVYRHCGRQLVEPDARPLRLQGEWFDDRILPFVTELMQNPQPFLDADKKKPRTRPANRDTSLHQGNMVLVFDSGETFRESLILKAMSPELALAALANIPNARQGFLAHVARITRLIVPGCPATEVSLRGAFVSQNCNPREGLSVILNSERVNGFATLNRVKQYSDRWLHGVPSEFYGDAKNWWLLGRVYTRPTIQFVEILNRFALALEQNLCVITAQNPLVVRGLFPRGIGSLPKGELRTRANQKAASNRRGRRNSAEARPKDGVVYFIQDAATKDIKIGFCLKNPEKRLADLQTGNSNPLRLVGHVLGSEMHEKWLHRRFARFRVHGEWFSNAIMEDVNGILKCLTLEDWMKTQDPNLPSSPASEPAASARLDMPT
jgi:hypothetical protein